MIYLLITIDVETPQTPLSRHLIKKNAMELVTEEGESGNSWILQELDKRNLKGVFYVNAYEKGKWGDDELAPICQRIANQGHEIGLHSHPAWMFDIERHHMWQYDKQDQIEIISKGKHLIESWVDGYNVVSHRAGAYGLNEDTLVALKENDIFIDSSMYYQHPNCKVIWGRNQLQYREDIFEIPVTGFTRQKQLTFTGFPLVKQEAFVKTDIDWASKDEVINFVNCAKKGKHKILNLFMHSYSFVKYNKDYSRYEADLSDMQRFREVLDTLLNDPEIQNVTSDELFQIYKKQPESFSSNASFSPLAVEKKPLSSVLLRRLGL